MGKISKRGGASVQRFDPPARPPGQRARRKTAKVETFADAGPSEAVEPGTGEATPEGEPQPEASAKSAKAAPRKRARKTRSKQGG